MNTSLHEWIASITGIASLLILGVFVPLFNRMTQLRDNHIQHILEGQERIEAKLDNHISWHLNGR